MSFCWSLTVMKFFNHCNGIVRLWKLINTISLIRNCQKDHKIRVTTNSCYSWHLIIVQVFNNTAFDHLYAALNSRYIAYPDVQPQRQSFLLISVTKWAWPQRQLPWATDLKQLQWFSEVMQVCITQKKSIVANPIRNTLTKTRLFGKM